MRNQVFLIFFILFFSLLSCVVLPETKDETLPRLLQDAEKGNAGAQYHLALAYLEGHGIPQDAKETAKWCRRAAEQGSSDGQLGLGLLYFIGKGVHQDEKKAYIWLNIAAAQGHTQAEVVRDMVEKKLDPETLSQARTLSKDYYNKYVAPFNNPS